MKVLVTGADGFIGQALSTALLTDPSVTELTLTDVLEPRAPITPSPYAQIRCVKADLTSPSMCEQVFTPSFTHVYLLHGIMSAAAEANLDLGLRVNIDSTRQILDHLRNTNSSVKVIYPSTTAVYGQHADALEVFTERTAPLPGSSYGAQKHIIETLLDDFSRRGLLDGRIVRLPTVTVRPGAPTGAASNFASGIFREPLKGEKSILPVSRKLDLWICSPRTVIENLIVASRLEKERYEGGSRIVNLPGLTVKIEEMLETLRQVGGDEALALVEERRDEATEKIVESWPTRFDTSRAKSLGFVGDGTLAEALRAYIEDYNIDQKLRV